MQDRSTRWLAPLRNWTCRCARSKTNGVRARSNARLRRGRAAGRRQPGAVPHRDPATLPPHGLFSRPSCAARDQGLLFQRLAPAPVAGRRAATGRNLFMPRGRVRASRRSAGIISAVFCSTRAPATVFANPTVNGYRRFRANSLAPDRAGLGHRSSRRLLRVLGGVGIRATRIENRLGEPVGQSLSLHPVADRHRPRRHRQCARSRGRRTPIPTMPTAPMLPTTLAGGARRCSNRSRCSAANWATSSSTTIWHSSAPKPDVSRTC